MVEDKHYSRGWKITVITGMLLCGTVTVVTAAAMLQLKAKGIDGTVHLFQKPWFETLSMFIGMFLCLPCHWGTILIPKLFAKKEERKSLLTSDNSVNVDKAEAGAGSTPPKKGLGWKAYLLIAAPASCDLIATLLMYIGLMMTTASVFQIMRGFMVVMSAFLSVTFLKRRLRPYKYLGVCIVIMGLLLVGVAVVVDPSHSEDANKIGSPLLGILLIIGAQLVQGTQIVVEEVLLKNVSLPPLLIVGVEGSWGIIFMTILLSIIYYMPGTDVGSRQENTPDTFVMLTHNAELTIIMVIYFFAILFYNYFGMCVTQCLSAVHRTILEAVRTACIWAVDLLLWYVITASSFNNRLGEWWTDWSVLELGGFVVMLIGTLTYNDFLLWPGFNYAPCPKKGETKK